jgi:hypothetical protein
MSPSRRLPRGAWPSPQSALSAATPYRIAGETSGNYIKIPHAMPSSTCASLLESTVAEEVFAKACDGIFIADDTAKEWISGHAFRPDNVIRQVLETMAVDGFRQDGHVYCDGPPSQVDWTDAGTLTEAVRKWVPVKIVISASQLEHVATAGKNGWFATGLQQIRGELECASLCGFGSIQWLAENLGTEVSPPSDPMALGYAMFARGSIGLVDAGSLANIALEAWSRRPTTVIR